MIRHSAVFELLAQNAMFLGYQGTRSLGNKHKLSRTLLCFIARIRGLAPPVGHHGSSLGAAIGRLYSASWFDNKPCGKYRAEYLE